MSEAPAVSLLKTCQTCFHAKIRCEKTQDSGLCDRCLRLGKPCVFAPSRRRKANRTVPVAASSSSAAAAAAAGGGGVAATAVRIEKPDAASSSLSGASPASGPTHPSSESASVSSGSSAQQIQIDNTHPTTYSPFRRNLLTYEKGQEFLDRFRTKMVPQFPFVLIPNSWTIQDLERDKPCLCIAVMCVSSTSSPDLQKTIGGLYNEMIAMRLLAKKGWFTSLDLLQCLLVGLAWAHFQPRPLRYSQHLAIAASIVADQRLDRPRIAILWSLNEELVNNGGPKLTPDEMRALAGTYYLTSSASVLMQKARFLNYSPYILDCSRKLTEYGGAPTDKFLPYIIYLQRLMEELDDAVSTSQSSHHLSAELERIRDRYFETKASIAFALSESPTIQLQLHVLELLICQPLPDSVTLGPDGFQNVRGAGSQSGLLDWLSQSLAAAKSLISVLVLLPLGEEAYMPNMSWVTLYSSASLAVRLDLLAAHFSLGHLRRILDLTYTLRQITLRLERLAELDESSDIPKTKNTFYHLSLRARQVERWYSHHTSQPPHQPQQQHSQPLHQSMHSQSPDMGMFSSSSSSPNTIPTVSDSMNPADFISATLVPNIQMVSDPDAWTAAKAMAFDPELSMGNMLFMGSDFFSDPSSFSSSQADTNAHFQFQTDAHMGSSNY